MDKLRRGLLSAAAATLLAPRLSHTADKVRQPRNASNMKFNIRTITAGIEMRDVDDAAPLHDAGEFLLNARREFENAGYPVQTVRVATQPLGNYVPEPWSDGAQHRIETLDKLAADAQVLLSLGPLITGGTVDARLPGLVADLIAGTEHISLSGLVATADTGPSDAAIRASAEAILRLSRATGGGEGNFRFAATACCPPGTPFFPAAYHQGDASFALGLESPPVLSAALEGLDDSSAVAAALKAGLEAELQPLEDIALRLARETGRHFGGIDTSPAPGPGTSIGQVIEALTGAPFGDASTLSACAQITGALQSVAVRRCGYSGLMLPPLEDDVLARRAAEGRYGVAELLLYSSVCGTGLDTVPLPGDVSVDMLSRLIGDVAALAFRYRKPLSARLFPVPGKQAGEMVSFDSPVLVDSVVMAVD